MEALTPSSPVVASAVPIAASPAPPPPSQPPAAVVRAASATAEEAPPLPAAVQRTHLAPAAKLMTREEMAALLALTS